MQDDTTNPPMDTTPAPAASDVLTLGSLAIHGDRKALFAALAKAQAGYAPIKRSRTVKVRSDKGDYTFDYAPLEEVLTATMPSLNAQGLAWSSFLADGQVEGNADLHTLLTHESGAFIHVVETLPPVNKAQERGSQVTYRRRYQYQCVTGTSPEVDDDGNAADGNKVEGVSQRQAPRREPPAQKPPESKPKDPQMRDAAPAPAQGAFIPKAPANTIPDAGTGDPMKPETAAAIAGCCRTLGLVKTEAAALCIKVTGRPSDKLDEAHARKFLEYLQEECLKKGGS